MKIVAAVLLICVVSSFALIIEKPTTRPKGWVQTGIADVNAPIVLQIALKHKNIQTLEEILLTIATPTSPTYSQWLTVDEIADIIAPTQTEINSVIAWLTGAGITNYEVPLTRDWVRASTTVGVAQQLLNCEIVTFCRENEHKTIMRSSGSYEIPDHLSTVVDFVAGLHGFPFSNWKPKIYVSEGPRVGGNTPSTLYSLYNIDLPASGCSSCNTSQAVVEFSNANYSPSDLQTFFTKYSPSLKGQVVGDVYIGTNNPNGIISVEANLDVQYIMAIGAFVETSYYVEPVNPDILDAFLDYTYFVGNQTNAPLVHSISWGEYGGQYDNSTVQRINGEFMKMGARGITINVASGDNGVGCGDVCQSEEFDFPSSPYCTLVGATQLGSNGIEFGATLSSGGFSRDYYRPSWQDTAVQNYLATAPALPPASSYYANGRGYPDVAALGVNIEIVDKGQSEAVDGTSCAAPIFSGVISLLNAARSQNGKAPLGWINPWIYSNPSMFNDQTSGQNSYLCCTGFTASAGWDPITGNGSPNYASMLQAALALP